MIRRTPQRRNFTVIGNQVVNDTSLSFDTLGMLVYCLSKPDHWNIKISELQRRSGVGRDKIRRMIRELLEAGYMVRTQCRGEEGEFDHIQYDVFDTPQKEPENTDLPPETDFQSTVKNKPDQRLAAPQNRKHPINNGSAPRPCFPAADDPATDNRPLVNTDSVVRTDREQKEREGELRSPPAPPEEFKLTAEVIPLQAGKQKTKTAHRWPDDFVQTEEHRLFATERGFNDRTVRRMWEAFKNHHQAKGTRFVDWSAAWRTWVNHEVIYMERNPGRAIQSRPPDI